MKRSIIFSAMLLAAVAVFAQQPVIEFKETSHDFGTIAEDGGRVTHTFEFTNTGALPLIISNVKASCGCTTPNWTKEPVEPGQKGIVTATYNPAGRPGSFTKTITVTSNASSATVRLSISGNVTPKPAKVADKYPVKAGSVGLHNRAVGLSNINYGDSRTAQLKVANIGKEPISVGVKFDEKFVSAGEPVKLDKEGDEGVINLTFNTAEAKTWGSFILNGQLTINGEAQQGEEYRIVLSGNVIEDFSKMREPEKKMAPICEPEGTTVNLGTLKKGTGIKAGKLRIGNQGAKSPLLIRRIVSHSDDLSVKAKKTSLAPGKKTDIVIAVNTDKLDPKPYKRSINIITNDPNRSNVIITVTWAIEE